MVVFLGNVDIVWVLLDVGVDLNVIGVNKVMVFYKC